MTTRPVSQAGIAKIDQLAENLDSGGSGALTRNDLGNFLQRRCVGYGVKFYYVESCKINSPMPFLGNPIFRSVRAYSDKETTRLIN